ncbi:flagellar basal body-associated FliL family protein [Salinibius halmophilus]|uniref:flagellar basal body-associated FliL family protein n=1 Tax=Salinibius halmophilus TaxID=1853216 RepID=UPI000E6703DE|nr:flagellar basal body-associated FliL family protein [Salinibius halmophilus]
MAEEDEKQEGQEGEEGKKSGKLKWIIIGVVALLVIIGATAAVTLIFFGGSESEPTVEAIEPVQQTGAAASEAPAIYLALQPAFVVNYRVGSRTRFLQLELSILSREDEALAVIDEHMPVVRNDILLTLQGQDYRALLTDEGKQALANQLTTVVQDIVMQQLGRPGIEKVLFTNFVLQ